MQGKSVIHLKIQAKLIGNNIVDMAPSVDEANVILGSFGYADRELAAA